MCSRGPVVPWSRLAPVWPSASSPAWLRLVVPGSRIGCPVAPFGVPAWSRGPVVPSGPVPRPQPGLESLAGRTRIGGSGGPFGVPAWSRGPVAPSGPVVRPQRGVNHCPPDPESVARWPRSVCPLGPVVPAWLGVGVPGSRIGGPVAPFGVPAWSRGPVVPSGSRLAPCLVPSLAEVIGPKIQIR